MDASDYRAVEGVAGGRGGAHPRPPRDGARGCRVHCTGVFVRAGQRLRNVIVRDGRGEPVAIDELTFSRAAFGTSGAGPAEATCGGAFYRVGADGTLAPW